MLLISYVVVIVVRSLSMFHVKTKTRDTYMTRKPSTSRNQTSLTTSTKSNILHEIN